MANRFSPQRHRDHRGCVIFSRSGDDDREKETSRRGRKGSVPAISGQ